MRGKAFVLIALLVLEFISDVWLCHTSFIFTLKAVDHMTFLFVLPFRYVLTISVYFIDLSCVEICSRTAVGHPTQN